MWKAVGQEVDNNVNNFDSCYVRCQHCKGQLQSLWSLVWSQGVRSDQLREAWCCKITEMAPTRTFYWLKAATTTFTFKKLLYYCYPTRPLQSLRRQMWSERSSRFFPPEEGCDYSTSDFAKVRLKLWRRGVRSDQLLQLIPPTVWVPAVVLTPSSKLSDEWKHRSRQHFLHYYWHFILYLQSLACHIIRQ